MKDEAMQRAIILQLRCCGGWWTRDELAEAVGEHELDPALLRLEYHDATRTDANGRIAASRAVGHLDRLGLLAV